MALFTVIHLHDFIKFTFKEDKFDELNQFSLSKAIDLTTEDIVPRLSKSTVTDLVIVSMLFLPRTMPSHFQETFTPIAAAGGQAQKEHLGRLMATQMTNAGIGIGVLKAKEVFLSFFLKKVSFQRSMLKKISKIVKFFL